jgi:hypothetical protein
MFGVDVLVVGVDDEARQIRRLERIVAAGEDVARRWS